VRRDRRLRTLAKCVFLRIHHGPAAVLALVLSGAVSVHSERHLHWSHQRRVLLVHFLPALGVELASLGRLVGRRTVVEAQLL
jgi:hypothetical protein